LSGTASTLVTVDVHLVLRGTTAPRRAVHVTRVERA